MINQERSVFLTEITQNDMGILFEWINDYQTVILNSSYKPVSSIEHEEWFSNMLKSKDYYFFGIRDKTNNLIGTCYLTAVNYVYRSAELQIRIGDNNNRGKGYGKLAVKELLRFAFYDLNLNRIYLHVFSDNVPAINVYEKSGFVREGVLRQGVYINGTYKDVYVYGILKEDFVYDV